MRLDAAQDQLLPAVRLDSRHDVGIARTGELHLRNDIGRIGQAGQFGGGVAKSLRILFGDEHRRADKAGGLHEDRAVALHLLAPGNNGQQFLLHVDHDEQGVFRFEKHSLSTSLVRPPAPRRASGRSHAAAS